MTRRASVRNWTVLQSKAHDPAVQAVIAEAIEDGMIRVVPAPNGGIRIIPLDDVEESDVARQGEGLRHSIETDPRYEGLHWASEASGTGW